MQKSEELTQADCVELLSINVCMCFAPCQRHVLCGLRLIQVFHLRTREARDDEETRPCRTSTSGKPQPTDIASRPRQTHALHRILAVLLCPLLSDLNRLQCYSIEGNHLETWSSDFLESTMTRVGALWIGGLEPYMNEDFLSTAMMQLGQEGVVSIKVIIQHIYW